MPKGIKKLQITFDETGLTHYGGMLLIRTFCKKLNLKWLLQSYVRFPQRSGGYHSSELITSLLYTIIAGISRINNTRSLQYNGAFQNLLGLKNFPDPSAFRRFLHRLSPKAIRQIVKVHNLLQKKIFYIPHKRTSLIFDLDATSLTVYGKHQKAKRGYNPKKQGRRCYCALLCFEANHRIFWHGSLHSGNISPVKISTHFLKICLRKIPYPIYRIRIRTDSGFYSRKFIEPLDDKKIGYTIESQIRGTEMLSKIQSLKYHRFKGDWEAGEFYYQPRLWKQPHRFVVIRRPLPQDPEECTQLSLFQIQNYGYRVIVTNLNLNPERIWYFHCQRAIAELQIKELKTSYPLTKIPAKSFTANVAYFHLLMFAFNIVNWFKRLCLSGPLSKATLLILREKLFLLPAKLTRSGHRNIMKFPVGYAYQKEFKNAMGKIENLKI